MCVSLVGLNINVHQLFKFTIYRNLIMLQRFPLSRGAALVAAWSLRGDQDRSPYRRRGQRSFILLSGGQNSTTGSWYVYLDQCVCWVFSDFVVWGFPSDVHTYRHTKFRMNRFSFVCFCFSSFSSTNSHTTRPFAATGFTHSCSTPSCVVLSRFHLLHF